MRSRNARLICVLAWLVVGCASEVQREPTRFSASGGEQKPVLVIEQDVSALPSSGYTATLKAGSKWSYVGRVPQGSVYAIKDDVFIVRGRNNHEAHCVVADGGRLVGFYLPVEQAFVPVQQQVQLSISR